jgi:alpha-glucosidase
MKKRFACIKYSLLISLLAVGLQVSGQVQNAGIITGFKKMTAGVEGKAGSSQFDIRAYSDEVIRVRISRSNQFGNFSYALASNEIPAFNATVTDRGKTIELVTRSVMVVIDKEPALRVTFKSLQGEIINEDMPGEGFGTTFIGNKVSSYKKLQDGERFVGLGEVLGNLDKRGSGFTLNNTDTYKYGDPRLSMYISIPFFIGIHHRLQYGLFYNNSYRTFFNFGLSTPFTSINADGGDADYFFIYGKSVGEILDHYSSLTGKMPLPPLWSLGYHQSRCSYYPQQKVMSVAETFRKKNIPVDCIVLDADYLQDYEPFRINKQRFPDMPALAAELRKMNIELTASVNPGIKLDSSYEAHLDGVKKDVFVKYTDGSLFVSEIAPSTNHFVDFTNPRGREWWIDKMKFLPDNGIHGYWNDMNEPAVNGSYLPDNLLFDFDGRKAGALEAKNVYGFQMARSSYESAIKYGNGRRPFILTRSAFAGVQRYAAVWSGDNTARDEYLLQGVLLNCQMGLSGIPFVGPDLGGYIGDGSKDLFKRWIEVGVFSPFVRNHKEFFASANEPWSYGEEAEAISKSYIGFRYRLMPYVYSMFYKATKSGMPVARSLCINYPYDDNVYDPVYQYQFLFGDALLVIPVTTQETVKKIYLPEGKWYDLNTEELLSGKKEMIKQNPIYQIPVYVRQSSIIPMQALVQSTKEIPADTLFVHVYYGSEKNEFDYYEDRGDGMEYQKGDYCERTITFDPTERKIIFSAQTGSFHSVFRKIQVLFHGFGGGLNGATVNGVSQPVQTCSVRLLDGLEYLEDYYDRSLYHSLRNAEPHLKQESLTFDNSTNEIVIHF